MFNNNIFCAEKKNILLKKIINKNIGFSLASIFSFTVLKGIFYICTLRTGFKGRSCNHFIAAKDTSTVF